MARLAVIVPVYNVERYLGECLDSIAAQTFDDLEVICVNDGSTDSSRAILAERAAVDARIRVIDQPNAGLSRARNVGIDAATAPYLCFVDSDDRLLPQACARMVAALDESGADLLTFGAVPFPGEAATIWLRDTLSPRTVRYDAFSIDLLFKERSRPFVWRTACRTAFLNHWHLRFDEGIAYGEDQVFHFAAYPRAGRVQLIADKLYEYRLARTGSLMGRFATDALGLQRAHTNIVARVYDDWSDLAILNVYATEMVSWTVEFVAFNALRLDNGEAGEACAALARVLRAHWDDATLRALPLARADRHMIDAVLDGGPWSRLHRERLRSASFFERYGARAWLAWLLRGRD